MQRPDARSTATIEGLRNAILPSTTTTELDNTERELDSSKVPFTNVSALVFNGPWPLMLGEHLAVQFEDGIKIC